MSNTMTKKDVIEVLILFIIFISLVFGDFLIQAIKALEAPFALGIILGGISAMIIMALFLIAKRAYDNKKVSTN